MDSANFNDVVGGIVVLRKITAILNGDSFVIAVRIVAEVYCIVVITVGWLTIQAYDTWTAYPVAATITDFATDEGVI